VIVLAISATPWRSKWVGGSRAWKRFNQPHYQMSKSQFIKAKRKRLGHDGRRKLLSELGWSHYGFIVPSNKCCSETSSLDDLI